MRVLALAVMLAGPAQAATPGALFPGIYTNEEDVYFAKEAGKPPPRATKIEIVREGDGLRLFAIDDFGARQGAGNAMAIEGSGLRAGECGMPFRVEGASLVAEARTGECRNLSVMTRVDAKGIGLSWPDGTVSTLRRARRVTCWGAALKNARKADGSEDWAGARDLRLHDQGGRAAFGGGDSGAKPVVIRMRNVIWPSGPNRPSLVLYVHTPDAPGKAVSYSWADPDAKRIGINLRWMQASCTIDKGGK